MTWPTRDQYSPLIDDPNLTGILDPPWVPAQHLRRLRAYEVLDGAYLNSLRFAFSKDKLREFGDPGLIVATSASAVIGSGIGYRVAGADPDRPDAVENKYQDYLDAWWTAELMELKTARIELAAARFGDAVAVLTWDAVRRRAVCRDDIQPRFFFPTWRGDEMVRIRIAWEEEADDGERQLYVEDYRIAGERPGGGELVLATAGWYRRTDEPSFEDLELIRYAPLDPATGEGEYKDVDLKIDFLPVLHVPNFLDVGERYGKAELAGALDILKALLNNDTDGDESAQLLGLPMLGIDDAPPRAEAPTQVKPGMVFQGKATLLSDPHALDALQGHNDRLLDRLFSNTRTPPIVAGRLKPQEVPSGIALAISASPLLQKTAPKRAIRKDKYARLLRFVLKFAVAAGLVPSAPGGRIPDVAVSFGDILPRDVAGEASSMRELVRDRLLSRRTAMAHLKAIGFPIDNVDLELEQIETESGNGKRPEPEPEPGAGGGEE